MKNFQGKCTYLFLYFTELKVKWGSPSKKSGKLAKKRRQAKAVSSLNRLVTKKDKSLKRMTTLKRKYQRKCARLEEQVKESQVQAIPTPLPTSPAPSTPQPSCSRASTSVAGA